MTIVLRPNQTRAVEGIRRGLKAGHLNQLVVAATGAGKTVVMASLRRELGVGGRVLILAHLDTLLDQLSETWSRLNPGDRIGIEQGPRRLDPEADYDCVVASVQTLAGKRLAAVRAMEFDLVVYDEVHHMVSPERLSLLGALGLLPESRTSGALFVGFTATPDRADKKSLRPYLPYLADEYSLWEAQEDGVWCPVHAHRVLTGADLTGVRLKGNGEFAEDELDAKLIDADRTQRLIDAWSETGGRAGRTVVSCSSRAHARSVAEQWESHCANVQYVDAESSDRAAVLTRFAAGPVPSVLVNVRLISEGVDVPTITHVVQASPIHSGVQQQQLMGRGTRTSPGKTRLTVLYAVDSVPKSVRLHSPASLMGLPAGFDLEGKALLEARRELESIIAESPVGVRALTEAGHLPETLGALRRLIDDMPLYVPTDLSGACRGRTELAWVVADAEALISGDTESAEHYLLRCPAPLKPKHGESEDERTLALDLVRGVWRCRVYGPPPKKAGLQARMRAMKDRIDGEVNPFRKFQLLKQRSQLRENAQAIPDRLLQDYALEEDFHRSLARLDSQIRAKMPSALKVVALAAPWRTDDPTPGQVRFAKKLGIPLVEGIRKGDLTLLIDHQLRRKEREKAK